MIRSTSIEAYRTIQENGLLSKRRWEVYDILYQHGPLTQLELAEHYFPGTQPRNVQPRVSELEDLQVVSCVGHKIDARTKMANMLWDVTDNLPIKPEKKKSKDKIIAELRAEIADLHRRLRGELF